MQLFNIGDFRLHSGRKSTFKIDCDALTWGDLEALANIAAKHLPSFGSVEGIPKGGLRWAECLYDYQTEGPTLIVDDVYTTGTSMLEAASQHIEPVLGTVIFARALPPEWVTPLFCMVNP